MKQTIEIEVPNGKKAVWKYGKLVFEDIYICTPKKEVKVEHEFVDLGLPSGRLWATCNIGAEKPTDYGDYFACGAVEPYNTYDCDTNSFNGTDAAKLSEMDDEHDAAKVLWGDDWRMPTLTDFAELIDNCTYNAEIIDGIRCCVFTSKANNQKIVMPAAGHVYGGSIYDHSGVRDVSAYGRNDGFSVPPVRS